MGLRTVDGIAKSDFEKLFALNFDDVYGDVCKELISTDLLIDEEDRLRLTDKGFELSNQAFEKFIR